MKPFALRFALLADCRPGRRRDIERVPVTHRVLPLAGAARLRSSNWALTVVLLAHRPGALAASGTTDVKDILGDLQRFFLAYSGVFALVGRIPSRTDVVAHPVPDRAADGLPAGLLTSGQPGAWVTVQPPPRRALPGGTHYGSQYGIVNEGMPRAYGSHDAGDRP